MTLSDQYRAAFNNADETKPKKRKKIKGSKKRDRLLAVASWTSSGAGTARKSAEAFDALRDQTKPKQLARLLVK